MAYNPLTDVPFADVTIPANTLLVASIPAEFRNMKIRINEVAKGLYDGLKNIGYISIWQTGTPPANCLEVNGQSTAGYTELAAIYGANLPDYRGWFLRGWAHGKSSGNGNEIDYNRGVGTQQGWLIGSHRHNIGVETFYISIHDIQGGVFRGKGRIEQTEDAGGADNRPSNIAVMYIVRAR